MASLFDSYFAHIYFFYGLAFFAMGLALWVESRRTSSQLRLVTAVRLLALFGLLHSAHEFAEMFDIINSANSSLLEDVFRAGLLAVSFLPLLAFGVQLLPYAERTRGFTARMTILVSVLFIMQAILVKVTYQLSTEAWIAAIHTITRYTIGMPGAVLAALGLFRQRRILLEKDMAPFGRDLALAAVAFIWYGLIGQAFPRETVIFPSMYVNETLFREWFGFPVQLFRAVMAMVVAVAMIRALRAFEEENRRRLDEAQQTERELKVAVRELALLYEASHLLTATQDLDKLIQEAIERIIQIIEPIKGGMIYVPETDLLGSEHCANYGSPHAVDSCIQLVRHSQEQDDPVQSLWFDKQGRNVTHEIALPPAGTNQTSSLPIQRIILPLRTRQRLVGSLLLETSPEGPFLSSLEAPTIIVLARQLAIAIENAQLVLQLREREARRAELLQRATNAQEAERTRVARELHDETGQALTALAVGLQGMSKLVRRDPERAAEQFQQLQAISTTALEELRHLISDLRPSHLDDLGLVAAIRWYIEQAARRSSLKIAFNTSGPAYRLPPELETTLFRITQESLTNVMKHSGAAHAHIMLDYEPHCVELCIADDGRGFDSNAVLRPGAGRAWGLIGIQERAELAGGRVDIQSSPGQGTTIIVSLPTSLPGSKPAAEEREATP